MPQTFPVNVYTPKGLVFQGEVDSITSVNEKGTFDILANHTNFITVIKTNLRLRLADQKTKDYPVDLGVLRSFSQEVDIYLGVSRVLLQNTTTAFDVTNH